MTKRESPYIRSGIIVFGLTLLLLLFLLLLFVLSAVVQHMQYVNICVTVILVLVITLRCTCFPAYTLNQTRYTDVTPDTRYIHYYYKQNTHKSIYTLT